MRVDVPGINCARYIAINRSYLGLSNNRVVIPQSLAETLSLSRKRKFVLNASLNARLKSRWARDASRLDRVCARTYYTRTRTAKLSSDFMSPSGVANRSRFLLLLFVVLFPSKGSRIYEVAAVLQMCHVADSSYSTLSPWRGSVNRALSEAKAARGSVTQSLNKVAPQQPWKCDK